MSLWEMHHMAMKRLNVFYIATEQVDVLPSKIKTRRYTYIYFNLLLLLRIDMKKHGLQLSHTSITRLTI